MSEQYCTVVRLSDSGLKARSYNEEGICVEETEISATEIVEVIESPSESDSIDFQHGPNPD